MKLEIVEWFLEKRLRGGVEEVETLRRAVSPGTRQRYTVTLICEALHACRSPLERLRGREADDVGGRRCQGTASLTHLEIACPYAPQVDVPGHAERGD